jgi:hypothetical protein
VLCKYLLLDAYFGCHFMSLNFNKSVDIVAKEICRVCKLLEEFVHFYRYNSKFGATELGPLSHV